MSARSRSGAAKTCDFRSGKIILQQPIDAEQMKKLLVEGRTDLLKRLHFQPHTPQVLGLPGRQDGKVGFEFEKKAPVKKPAVKKTAT